MKNQKGSITLFVLLSVLFFIFLLVGIFINFANKSGTQEKQISEIQENYNQYTSEEGQAELFNKIITTLPTTSYTTPWLPEGFGRVLDIDSETGKITGTNLETGLVISNTADGKEGTQNYVWIEVPTNTSQTITIDGTTKTIKLSEAQNDDEIQAILEEYVGNYRNGSGSQGNGVWEEEWYDLYNATWDGTSEYAQIKNKSSSNFSKWKEYYGDNVYTSTSENIEGEMTKVDFSTETYLDDNFYFVKVDDKFKNHDDGCGLTWQGYQDTFSKMLRSVQEHGGFWISQYEAGIAYEKEGEPATNRTIDSPRITNPTKANYAKDQYPYNYIQCSEAQKIAAQDSTSEYTSSLLFGIQWDLVCKFIETKTDKTYENIAVRSIWGNYTDTLWTSSTNSRYSTTYSRVFSSGTYSKASSEAVLLTTGAIDKATISGSDIEYMTNPMNIYDFAGNLYEYTLEHTKGDPIKPCAIRGGAYTVKNESEPASFGYFERAGGGSYNEGFRSSLY